MRISDWSSDVCSSDLIGPHLSVAGHPQPDRTASNQNKTWSRIMIDAVSADAQLQTILIVDDNPVNLSVVIDHLEEHGFQVAVAQGGEEALKRAELIEPRSEERRVGKEGVSTGR